MALGDLQEEPSAGKPHARICEGESRMAELLDQPRPRDFDDVHTAAAITMIFEQGGSRISYGRG